MYFVVSCCVPHRLFLVLCCYLCFVLYFVSRWVDHGGYTFIVCFIRLLVLGSGFKRRVTVPSSTVTTTTPPVPHTEPRRPAVSFCFRCRQGGLEARQMSALNGVRRGFGHMTPGRSDRGVCAVWWSTTKPSACSKTDLSV